MKKTKLTIIIVLIIVLLIIILLYTMYKIDINRMKNGEPVKFSNWGYAYSTINSDNQSNSIHKTNTDKENIKIDFTNYNENKFYIKTFIIIMIVILIVNIIVKRYRNN